MTISFLILSLVLPAQKLLQFIDGNVSFKSDAPMELIEAETETIVGLIDTQKKTFAFRVPVSSFEGFNSPLQREHFNENYLETNRYPYTQFSGEIEGEVDFKKAGSYEVTAKGIFDIHGIQRERAINAVVTVARNGDVEIETQFVVRLADHDIKIPTIVRYKIAETINVSFIAKMIKR
jgi:polyisoprenoid-binding protein YceI